MMSWNHAVRKLCDLNFTFNVESINLFLFSVSRPKPHNYESRLAFTDWTLKYELSVYNLIKQGQVTNTTASETKTTPEITLVHFWVRAKSDSLKWAQKRTSDWKHNSGFTHPQSPSIIIFHTNKAFRWTKSHSIGSTQGVCSVSGGGKRSSQPDREPSKSIQLH